MSSFKINLARDYTMSGKNRTRFYWLMIFYFFLCGMLLIHTALQAAHSVNQISENKRELSSVRQRFAEKYPAAESIPEYNDFLENRLNRQQRVIDQLLKNTSSPVPLAECLYRISADLPQNVRLSGLKINSDTKPMTASISFSIDLDGSSRQDPSVLVQQWKEDSSIQQIFTDITLVDRQDNVKVREETVTKFTCSATLKQGES